MSADPHSTTESLTPWGDYLARDTQRRATAPTRRLPRRRRQGRAQLVRPVHRPTPGLLRRVGSWLGICALLLAALGAQGCAAPTDAFLEAERATYKSLAHFVEEQAQAELARVTSALAADPAPTGDRRAVLEQRAKLAENALADLEAWDYGLDHWEEALRGR